MSCFLFRSLGGRDPANDSSFYDLIDRLEKINPRVNGYWQNMTLCTLYKSCSEITKYKHGKHEEGTCEECKVTYNHCPWIPKERSHGVSQMLIPCKFRKLAALILLAVQIIAFFWCTLNCKILGRKDIQLFLWQSNYIAFVLMI